MRTTFYVASLLCLALLTAGFTFPKKREYEADGWIHPDPDHHDGIKMWDGADFGLHDDADEDVDSQSGGDNPALKAFLAAHPEWADKKTAWISPQAFQGSKTADKRGPPTEQSTELPAGKHKRASNSRAI